MIGHNTKTDGGALADRIWNTFPVAQPAFTTLLSLLEITTSDRIPTAAVSSGDRSRLLLNPRFIAEHCRTDEALVMLVLHEMHHVILGHTRLFRDSTAAHNLAFDAVINAQLCLAFPQPHWTKLLRDFYEADRLPWALLRPPVGWRSAGERWLPGRAGALHRQLYSPGSTSYEEILRMIEELARDEGLERAIDVGRLLGNHEDAAGAAGDAETPPDLVPVVEEILRADPRSGAGPAPGTGADLHARRLTGVKPPPGPVTVLRRALHALMGGTTGRTGPPRRGVRDLESTVPWRTREDRRAVVRETLGAPVLINRFSVPFTQFHQGEPVDIYLDVSGSMAATIVGRLYAALASLAGLISPQVWLFSTQVVPISRESLRRMDCHSTGGTDIAPVLAHALATGVRRALIITDGYVGEVNPEQALALKRRRARLGVVLTPAGSPAFAASLGARVWSLPRDLEHKEASRKPDTGRGGLFSMVSVDRRDGGRQGARTLDLRVANAALSQLS